MAAQGRNGGDQARTTAGPALIPPRLSLRLLGARLREAACRKERGHSVVLFAGSDSRHR